ncbi:toprim domain-containing protein [Candidatus Saccharibacteria bacterium]|nr:toprim domain-containing protein [Candidatus Saccharibacteria bacterium]
MNRKTVEEFKIGYAGDAKAGLKEFLLKRGYTEAELKEAGLLNRFGGDLFKERLMIPLLDTNGEVVGYTGRTIAEISDIDKKLGKSEGPKYLNTPATLLYDKTHHIYGLSGAKMAIRENGFVVVVEGNMDVIASHQAGKKMAVATAGTAMTKQHLQTLGKLTEDIRLAYDGDKAGQAAAERAVEIASELGLSLLIVDDYHGAKDADELIQKDPKFWEQAIHNAKPAAEWLLGKYSEELDLNSPIGKRKYSEIAGKLIEKLSDPIEKDHYKKLVAGQIDTTTEVLDAKAEREKAKKPVRVSAPKMAEKLKRLDKKATSSFRSILGRTMALLVVKNAGELDKEKLERYNEIKVLLFGGEERYSGWTKEEMNREMEELLQKAKQELNKIKRQQTSNLLEYAMSSGRADLAKELLLIMNKLTEEQRWLNMEKK